MPPKASQATAAAAAAPPSSLSPTTSSANKKVNSPRSSAAQSKSPTTTHLNGVPSSGGGGVRKKKYLERPEVMGFMDDIVKKCMIDEPEDPGKHIYEYLKAKYEEKVAADSSSSSNANSKTSASSSCPITVTTTTAPTKSIATPVPPPSGSCHPGFQRSTNTNGPSPPLENAPPVVEEVTGDAAWFANCTLEHLNRRLEVLNASVVGVKVTFPEIPEGQPKHPLLPVLETKLVALAAKISEPPSFNVSSSEPSIGLPVTPRGTGRVGSRGGSLDCSNNSNRKTKSAVLKEDMANALFNAAQLLNNNNSLEMSSVINSVVNSVMVLLRADRCACFIANDKTRTLSTTIEGKEFSLKYGQGIAGHVARTECSLMIPNAYEDKRFDPSVDMELKYTTRDILCLPVSLNNDLIAVVQLVNKQGGGIFTKDDEQLFVSFAEFAGIKIRNALLFKEQTRLALRNKAMSEVTETLANTELVESRLIPVIVKSAKGIVGADRCAFFTVNQERSVIVAHLEGVQEQLELPLDSGVVGHVAKTKQVLNVPKAYDDPRFNKEVDTVSGYHTQNILCIPIFVDKCLVAVSQLVNKTLEDGEVVPFNEEDEEVLQAFASVAGVCIRNCRLFENAERRKKMMETTLEIAKGVGMGDMTRPENIMSMVSDTVCDFTLAEMTGLFIVNNDYSMISTTRGGEASMIKAWDHRFQEAPQIKMIEFSYPAGQSLAGKRASVAAGYTPNIVMENIASTPSSLSNIIGDCCRSQRSQLYTNVSAAQLKNAFGDGVDCKEVYLTPVVVHDEGVGVLALVNKRANTGFNENDKEMVHLFSSFVAVAVRNSKLILAAQEQVNDWASLMKLERAGTDVPGSSDTNVATATSDTAVPGSLTAGYTSPEASNSNWAGGGLDASNRSDMRSPGSVFGMAPAVWQPVQSETVDRLLAIVPDPDALRALDSMDFNVHQYVDGLLPSDELVILGIEMFRKLGFFSTFKIKPEVLCKFIIMVKSKYRRVPYHSFFHAFDVTQTIYQFLTQGRLSSLLNNNELLGLFLAGLVHDIDHMGLNNAFHLKAETPMGILTSLTGTRSVLEVHHCQLAIELLGHTNLLGELEHTDRSAVYKTIIDAVLATDMAVHKDICGAVEKDLIPALGEHMHRASTNGSYSSRPLQSGEARRLVVIMILKMADISNVSKPFNVSRRWGIQVMDEFHAQGNQEKKRGLEVTPMFAERQELAKSQLGFINMMAYPFFALGVKCFPTLEYVTAGITKNMEQWQRLLVDQQQAGTAMNGSSGSQKCDEVVEEEEDE